MNTEYLTQKEFDDLLEYSTSIPTGTTLGKKWKRHIFSFKSNGKEYNAGYIPANVELVSDAWWMGEYITDPDPKRVGIRWSTIVIAGALEIDKNIKRFEERQQSLSD